MASDSNFQHLCSKGQESGCQMSLTDHGFKDEEMNDEAQHVFDALKDDFHQSKQDWRKPVPEVTYKFKLPSLVSPLKKLSQTAVNRLFSMEHSSGKRCLHSG